MAAITVDGASLAYDDAGHDEPAFVFVHDWGADRSSWAAQLEDLAGRHRCVAVDLRGHGESEPRPPYDAAILGDDVAALMRELGLQQAMVVGHGLGSVVALELNDRHPGLVVGLVIGELPFGRAGDFDPHAMAGELREAGGMRPAQGSFERQFGAGMPPEVRDGLRGAMLRADPGAAAGMLEANAGYRERLGGLVKMADQKPFMAIWGGRGPEDDIVKWLRHETVFLRQEPVMGAGHFFQLEKPAVTNALLRAFVEDVLSDPRLAALGLGAGE